MELQPERVCLIGHSHVALYFVGAEGGGEGEAATRGAQAPDERGRARRGEWLINPGSVGQPRDGDPRAAWLELDTDGWSAVFRRVAYEIPRRPGAIPAAVSRNTSPSAFTSANDSSLDSPRD